MEKLSPRKKKKRIILICSILFICGLCFSVVSSIYVLKKPHHVVITGEYKHNTVTTTLSMIAVGDALIHDDVYNDANTKVKDEDGNYIYNFKGMLSEIKPIIAPYDLRFYNQETIIGGKKIGLSAYPSFNSPDEIGLDMVGVGFNVVNLASNHTLDRGEKAILYSTGFWKNQNVLAIGSYASKEDRDEVKIQTIHGIRYAILSYTTLTNGIKVPEGKDYLVNVYSKEKVKKDIEKVRDKVDILMVSMHWGEEYTHTPVSSQKQIANYLSSLGVDVIIGTHPHVVEPIEMVGNTLVIYSLGNFLSGQEGEMKQVGLITGFTYKKTVENGEVKISLEEVKTDLLYTYSDNYTNFKVIPFSHLTEEQLPKKDKIYETYMNYVNPYGEEYIKEGFIE